MNELDEIEKKVLVVDREFVVVDDLDVIVFHLGLRFEAECEIARIVSALAHQVGAFGQIFEHKLGLLARYVAMEPGHGDGPRLDVVEWYEALFASELGESPLRILLIPNTQTTSIQTDSPLPPPLSIPLAVTYLGNDGYDSNEIAKLEAELAFAGASFELVKGRDLRARLDLLHRLASRSGAGGGSGGLTRLVDMRRRMATGQTGRRMTVSGRADDIDNRSIGVSMAMRGGANAGAIATSRIGHLHSIAVGSMMMMVVMVVVMVI